MNGIDKWHRLLGRSGLLSSLFLLSLLPFFCEAAEMNLGKDVPEGLEPGRVAVEKVTAAPKSSDHGRKEDHFQTLAAQSLNTEEKRDDLYTGPPKAIRITHPQDGSTVEDFNSRVSVLGLLSAPDSRVFVGGKEADVSGKTFVVQGVKLSIGENRITTTAIDRTGATSTDTITLNYKPLLRAYISFPFHGTMLSTSPIDVSGIVTDPSARLVVNGMKANVSPDGRFWVSRVPLSEGDNEITMQATRWDGQSDTRAIMIRYHPRKPSPPPIALSITSPQTNAVIRHPKASVTGTFASTADEVWIRVNEVVANTYGNRFAANDVPIDIPLGDEGSCRIVVVAEDSNGASERTETTVAVVRGPHVRLVTNITTGVGPFTSFFCDSAEIPNLVKKYQMDFEGDGINDYEGATFDDIKHTYASEGVYSPQLTVTDSEGNIYSDSVDIFVVNKDRIRSIFKKKWEGMTTALLAGKIEDALDYILPEKQDEYRRRFAEWGDKGIKSIFSNIIDVRLDSYHGMGSYAQCSMIRAEKTGRYLYSITFVPDSWGLWKIYGF